MNRIKILLVCCLLAGAGSFIPGEASAQQVSVSLSVFQNDLGRYGRWVSVPRYGQVWIYNEPGFRPYYTNGHWEYTNFGWTWVSNYPWGWAPFHYGRWELDPYYGWIWIPDYDWAPAWVTWSQYDGGYGWAPLGFGISLNISFGAIPYDRWIFVPRQDICRPDIYRYRVSPGAHHVQNAVVINNIYVNNNIRFARGPQRQEVERYTHSRIRERKIEYGRPHELLADNNRPSSGAGATNNIQRPTRPQVSGSPATGGNDRPITRPDDGRNNGNIPHRPGISGSPATDNNLPVTRPGNDRRDMIQRRPGVSVSPENRGNDLPARPGNNLPARPENVRETPVNRAPERTLPVNRNSQDRMERPASVPSRMERPSQSPSRMERPASVPSRMERPASTPSRVEHSSPAPSRMERSTPMPSRTESQRGASHSRPGRTH